MFATIARKTFDLYALPARLAYRQSRRNLDRIKKLHGEFRQWQDDSGTVADRILGEAGRQLGIDPSAMSEEQRIHQAKAALANAGYGVNLALTEGLKALLLLTASEKKPQKPSRNTGIIEGEYQRIEHPN